MSLTSDSCAPMLTMPVQPAGYGYGGNSGGNMWGGDGAWWIVLFLIFGWGWGGNGWGGGFGGNGGASGALTRGDLCMDMNFQELQNGVRNINDAVNLGFSNLNSTICHQQYDTAMLVNGVNQNINGVTAAVNGGFAALNSTICQQQYDTAAQLNAMNMANMANANAANVVALQNANAIQSQLADCCCKTQTGQMQLGNQIERSICETNYNAANNTNAVIQNAHGDTDRIIARLDAMENARKDEIIAAQNQRLFAAELAASQSAQNAYLINTLRPTPVPCYPASSPCGYNWSPNVLAGAYGNGGGCGCCA